MTHLHCRCGEPVIRGRWTLAVCECGYITDLGQPAAGLDPDQSDAAATVRAEVSVVLARHIAQQDEDLRALSGAPAAWQERAQRDARVFGQRAALAVLAGVWLAGVVAYGWAG